MNQRQITFHTVSAAETIALGQRLGLGLKDGDVIALVGELGSGKTWFAKGIGLGLGVSPDTVITSPSFSLVNEYDGRYRFFHIDGYRLEGISQFLSAGLDEYLHMEGVVAMEWADRWPEILPDRHVWVEINIEDEQKRKITLSGHHPRALNILTSMEAST